MTGDNDCPSARSFIVGNRKPLSPRSHFCLVEMDWLQRRNRKPMLRQKTAEFTRKSKSDQPPAIPRLGDGPSLLIGCVKALLRMDSVWCVRKDIVQAAISGHAADSTTPQEAVPYFRHSDMDVLQVAEQACVIVSVMLNSAADAGVREEDLRNNLFFAWLTLPVKNKKILRPSHLLSSASCVDINMLTCVGRAKPNEAQLQDL